MPPILYRCPNTGEKVQAWAADDPEEDDLSARCVNAQNPALLVVIRAQNFAGLWVD